jgi:hypothetical protein
MRALRSDSHNNTTAGDTAGEPPTPAVSAGFLSIAWIPERDLQVEEWSRIGQRLGMMGRCNQWWIGDWIRYGNSKYGEKYSRAAKLTGYDVQSLTNMVYVATSFDDIARRRDGLSWSHHEAVAALEPARQDQWLTMAAGLKWSVNDLRVELRAYRKGRGGESTGEVNHNYDPPGAKPPADHDQAQAAEDVCCPHCGGPVPRSLFASNPAKSPDVGTFPEAVSVA